MYKWVDEDGTTHYGDKPPGNKPTLEITGEITSYQQATVSNLPEGFFKRNAASRKRVIMYSTSWCGYCKKAKAYFINKKIKYTEYDIEKSAKGRADYNKLNGRGVPIILIGQKRMNGFSVERFDKLYKD